MNNGKEQWDCKEGACLYKQGFIYQYNLPYRSNKINSSFGSVSLKKLKEKVIKKGLPWGIIDEQKVMEIVSV